MRGMSKRKVGAARLKNASLGAENAFFLIEVHTKIQG